MLTSGRRDSPKRQQTLRAALEWSHGLLNAEESAVFRRLAVFVGGFGLEMAQRVVADFEAEPHMDEWTVVDVLSSLVDRSLVAVGAGEPPRYRLLESARVFALERLLDAGERDVCRHRHAHATFAHFEAIDADVWAGRTGVDASRAFLEADLGNAREAMAWAISHDALMSLAFTPVMSHSLPLDGYRERRQLWDSTASLVTDDVPDRIRAPWALWSAHFFREIDVHRSVKHALVARSLFRRLGCTLGLYHSLGAISNATGLQASDERLAALDEMRSIERSDWSAAVKFSRAMAELQLAADLGDYDGAQSANRRLLVLLEAAGNESRMTVMESNRIEHLLKMRNADAAVALGVELERRLRGSRNQWDLVWVRLQLTCAFLAQGAIESARDLAMVAWPQVEQFDQQRFWADRLAWLAVLEGRARTSAQLLGYANGAYACSGAYRCDFDSQLAEQVERMVRARMSDVGVSEFLCARRFVELAAC